MSQSNARGPIADTYHALQGLAHLERAREQTRLCPASDASRLRCVLQAAEVAVLNVADLQDRAAADVAAGAPGLAAGKLRWALGFHRVLSWLGRVPHVLPGPASGCDAVRFTDSPGYSVVLASTVALGAALIGRYGDPPEVVGDVLTGGEADDPCRELFHLSLICAREAATWDVLFAELPTPAPVTDYRRFVGTGEVGAAVREMALRGDTFMTQFRGLHQIPEILAAEAGDLVEAGVRWTRAGDLPAAARAVRAAAVVFEGALPCLQVIVDNLTAADYHRIRENLGQTSGSHSVALHHHLFHDLYEQLAAEVTARLPASDPAAEGTAAWSEGAASATYALAEAAVAWRALLMAWRELHLALPRNALGGSSTRSLIGSADAVTAVRKLRDAAAAADPMAPVARAFGLAPAAAGVAPLRRYLDGESSWDGLAQRSLGVATKARFPQVQARAGAFAGRCPFAPPKARRVN